MSPNASAPQPRFTISVFPDTSALAEAVAAGWLRRMDEAALEKRPFSVALSGGRIAHQFLAGAARRAAAGGSSLDGVDFFWSDERCVSPDSKDANYEAAWRHFLAPTRIDPRRIHRLEGELPPETAALRAEDALRAVCAADAAGTPVLDLVFLGMGEDGHVASLFPGVPEDAWNSQAAFVPVIGPKPPPQRLSVTPRVLAAAREVWVIASGADKQEAWRRSVTPGGFTPLARILAARNSTQLWIEHSLLTS